MHLLSHHQLDATDSLPLRMPEAFTLLHSKAVSASALALCPSMDLLACGSLRGGVLTLTRWVTFQKVFQKNATADATALLWSPDGARDLLREVEISSVNSLTSALGGRMVNTCACARSSLNISCCRQVCGGAPRGRPPSNHPHRAGVGD